MNQSLLIRLFRAIDGDKNDDVVKVASLIIENEQKKGHAKLASTLKSILDKNVFTNQRFKGELRKMLPSGVAIPTDKRNHFPLAAFIERDELRHEMVLPLKTEEKIRRVEKEYAAKERLAHHGLNYRRKVLIYGAPGCGKSMSAERIAWNLGLPFFKVRFDVMISSFLGETASNLTRLFEGLEGYPCVLLFDEFDIVGKTRSGSQDVGEMHRVVNILLTLLEDYNSNGILIATTNIENVLDDALFRRFDDIIEMPKPTKDEILALVKLNLSSMEKSNNIHWEEVAERLVGFSAALVVKIARDAAKIAVIGNEKIVNQNHIETSLGENIQYLK
ncbi:MAG: ATP-binding protein [Cyclobacteriaceae bacterium]